MRIFQSFAKPECVEEHADRVQAPNNRSGLAAAGTEGALMKNEKFISRLTAIASLILILVKIWIAAMHATADYKACPRRAPPVIETPIREGGSVSWSF